MKTGDLYSRLKSKLEGRQVRIQNETDYFASAVVVPLVVKNGELGILFEVRSAKLKWQPGEICFPGGRIEPWDIDPEATAIRETMEELCIAEDVLNIFGPLDFLVTHIGILLYPFVGRIGDYNKISPSSDEVAEVFVVPLKYLLDYEPVMANMEVSTKPLPGFPLHLLPADYPRDWKRRTRYPVLFYQYGDYVIWGLTARVLHNFLEICREL